MKQPSNLMRRIGGQAVLSGQPLPGIPIVELAGDRRVLIENHLGILAYGLEEIQVKMSYGKAVISGQSLTISQLSAEQLVVCGQISAVQLCRR